MGVGPLCQISASWLGVAPQFDPTFEVKVSHLGRRKADIVWYFEKVTEADLLTKAFAVINLSIHWCSLTVGKLA